MRRPLTDCQNCSQRFESQYSFCPYCGMKSKDKLTLGILFNNTISNYFSVDARIFRSVIPLMFKPGYLAEQFVNGRRLVYMHPAQMYLFVSVVFFSLFSFISRKQTDRFNAAIMAEIEQDRDAMDPPKWRPKDSLYLNPTQVRVEEHSSASTAVLDRSEDKTPEGWRFKTRPNSAIKLDFNEVEIDSMLAAGASDEEIYRKMGMQDDSSALVKRIFAQILKFFKNKSVGSILQAFYDSIPLAMFILLPIFAVFLKLLYFRKGRYVYHLVFAFYFFAFIFSIFSLWAIGELIWKSLPGWLTVLVMFVPFLYLLFGVKYFYRQGNVISFLKSSALSFVFLAVVLPFAFVIMGLMAFLFY